MSIRQLTVHAAAIGALTAAVAACGGSSSPPDSASIGASTGATNANATEQGGSIVFRRFLKEDQSQGAIFTIKPDGTGERQLSKPGGGFSDDFPDFAADGSIIAFQRCREAGPGLCRIFIVRPDGTGLHAVGGCHGPASQCPDASYPAVAPNGRQIAFVRGLGRILEDQFEHQGIYKMRTDGSHLRRVTLPAARTAEDENPNWSSDGRQIVFVRQNLTAEPVGRQALFVVRADGSRLRRITPWNMDAGDGPVWAPDDSRILFRAPAHDDFLNSNLYTIRPDGRGLRQITHVAPTTRLYSSSFSPDGTSIAFGMTGVAEAADVFTMRTDGTGLKPVTRTPLHDSAPDWGTSTIH
jgi:Tol biopolymer transport system component